MILTQYVSNFFKLLYFMIKVLPRNHHGCVIDCFKYIDIANMCKT